MAEIFISYAREDRGKAEWLARALEPPGWTVWWDRHIPAGRRFDEVIAERLAVADCVLVLWSKAANRSEWVVEEAETARERGILVPAMIEEVEPPLGFRRIHAADLIGWNGDANHAGFVRLIADIGAVLRRGSSLPASESLLLPQIAATAAAPAEATPWDPTTIHAIERRFAQVIGPIAHVLLARALRECADMPTILAQLGRHIPSDADRDGFIRDAARFVHSSASGHTARFGEVGERSTLPTASRHLSITDASLREIEKALARYIGPIAKVVVKRAVAQSGTADELCATLLTHIEREDDRRQFRAAVVRFV